MRDIKVAAVQFEHAPGDKQANFSKIRRFVKSASDQGVEIIAFPECCITGYWFMRKLSSQGLRDLAEPVPQGPSSQALLALAREFEMTVGAGLVEVDAQGKLHNTYVVAMPNGELRFHRKIHAFEHDDMVPGSEFTVFDTPHGCRVGVLICYDINIKQAQLELIAGGASRAVGSPHICHNGAPSLEGKNCVFCHKPFGPLHHLDHAPALLGTRANFAAARSSIGR